MSDTEKFKLPDRPPDLDRLDEGVNDGQGRIEYDELGNAVWVPYRGVSGQEALKRLLNDDTLAVTDDASKGTISRIQENRAGLRKGYDPYDSGLLLKKTRKKKKNLRALSEWIVKQKKDDSVE